MRNSLKALVGVNEVEVDLDEQTAIVFYDDTQLTAASMIEATTAIGFPSLIADLPAAELQP